jgi:hypothetical protein
MRDRDDDSFDELFEVLSHEYRRYILWSLADPDGRTDEPIRTTLFAGDDEPDILRIELRHNHLPKLDDAGLVDWDPETETLTRGPRFEEIEPLLGLLDDNRDELPGDWP